MINGTTLTGNMPIQKNTALLPIQVQNIPKEMFTLDEENQCHINHAQTLERMRERNGLGINEALAILLGVSHLEIQTVPLKVCHIMVNKMVNDHRKLVTTPVVKKTEPDWSKLPLTFQQQADNLVTVSQDVQADDGSRIAAGTVSLVMTCLASAFDKITNPPDDEPG